MITVSEPLVGSQEGYLTLHEVRRGGDKVGRVEVNYLQEEELSSFKKAKRKMRLGQPFSVKIFLNDQYASLGREYVLDAIRAVISAFDDLQPRDIYVIGESKAGKIPLGRGHDLLAE